MTGEEILKYLTALDKELAHSGCLGEIGMVGGAVMCLVFKSRAATRDVDGVFEPTEAIRTAAASVAKKHDLAADWLNDAAKGYLIDNFKRDLILQLPNLQVWVPEARYMLAMKCISGRWDSFDADDVRFLVDFLKLKSPESVFQIIEDFYPKRQIPVKTKFFVEEIFDQDHS